jgi:hypothetical protein
LLEPGSSLAEQAAAGLIATLASRGRAAFVVAAASASASLSSGIA